MSRLAFFKRSSISRRLVGFSLVFVTLTVIVTSLILYLIIAGLVRQQIDQRLDTQLGGLRSALSFDADGAVALASALDGPPFDRHGSGWYWQVSGDRVHITSRSLAGQGIHSPPRPFEWRHVLSGDPLPAGRVQYRGEELYIRVAEATIGGKAIEISVTAPQSALSAPARRALFWLIPAMAVLGIVLLAGVLLQVHYGLLPLRHLTSNVSEITAGRLPRLPEFEFDELGPVTQEINRLVEQNRQQLADTRLHFANLAHGLKTPVSSLSLALNSTNDPEGEMRSLVDRIDQRVHHHLARARKTAAGRMSAATVLKPRIDDLMLAMSRIHANRGMTPHYDIDPKLSVACGEDDIDEILGNLIDNAFKWATSTITVSAGAESRSIAIVIEDDGPGMTDAEIREALLPGRRIDETVPGHGFGLTIATELVQLYGGTVALGNGHATGLRQVIVLPKGI